MNKLSQILVRLKNGKESNFKGLGVFTVAKKVYLYFYATDASDNLFRAAISDDGLNFRRSNVKPAIFAETNRPVEVENLQILSFAQDKKTNYLFYKESYLLQEKYSYATSNHLIQWKTKKRIAGLSGNALLIPNTRYKKQYVMALGKKSIYLSYSDDLISWSMQKKALLEPRRDFFDSASLQPELTLQSKKGILLFYHSGSAIGTALLDAKKPEKILQRSEKPIWQQPAAWKKKQVYFIGAINFQNK